jgi:hypothetical protein
MIAGVQRHAVHVGGQIDMSGHFDVELEDGDDETAALVLYTLDSRRLCDLFDRARSGASNGDLLFELDAVALGEGSV